MHSQDERDPFEAVADEFLQRHRRGESPSIEEFARNHPELADEIRDLLPTILAMEDVKSERDSAAGPVLTSSQPTHLGDYRIIREIGRGGMGIVYEAEQESLGRRVAVKVLPKGPLLSEKQLHRFQREASTAARLHHTNIVQVFGVGEQDGLHYYVMQYIRGVGLERIVYELGRQLGPNVARGADIIQNNTQGVVSRFSPGVLVEALRSGRFSKIAPQRSSDASHDPATVADGQHNGGSASESLLSQSSAHSPVTQVSATNGAAMAGLDPALNHGHGRSMATEADLPASGLLAHDTSLQVTATPSNIKTNLLSPAQRQSGRDADLSRLRAPYFKSIARLGMQVADALQYAHSQGVLHRDIKPANLLLDARGTVWITDFGLAKALEQPGVTDTGDLLGTLLYMAPEQFEGKYDQRSDIYSLGVTLHELLTLQPVYTATNQRQLIQMITQSEPRRPRAINPHLPRDLETIVMKATARDPARRYKSAGELCTDLENYLEDRPILARRVSMAERLWRWCRRNKALATLGGIVFTLLLLLAVTGTTGYISTRNALGREAQQRVRAENASTLAEEALEKIFDQLAPQRVLAAGELTVDIQEGQEIDVPVQLPLSKETAALLDQLLVYYDRLAAQGTSDGKLRRKQAQANRRVGDIQFRLGQTDAARKAYQQSALLYQEIRNQEPGDVQMLVELARVHHALGKVYFKEHQHNEGRSSFRTAIHLLESAEPDQSSAALIRYELATNYYQLGKGGPPGGSRRGPGMRSSKKRWDGREYLQKSVALLEKLVEDYPGVPAYRHLLALCYQSLSRGPVFRVVTTNSPSREKAINLLRELVEQHPNVPDYRYDLSETLGLAHTPSWFFPKRPDPETEQEVAEALELATDLVDQFPNITDYKILKSVMHHNLGFMEQRGKKLKEANQNYREALKLQNSLVRAQPDVAFHQIWKTKLEASLANVLREQKKYAEAKKLLLSSIKTIETGSKEKNDSKMGYMRMSLPYLYGQLALVHRELGETELADEATRKATELRSPPQRKKRD